MPRMAMARSYQPILRKTRIDYTQYPAVDGVTLAPALHDISMIQGLFENGHNFSDQNHCEIFEIEGDEGDELVGSWQPQGGDDALSTWIKV